jgi:hypothetical protein
LKKTEKSAVDDGRRRNTSDPLRMRSSPPFILLMGENLQTTKHTGAILQNKGRHPPELLDANAIYSRGKHFSYLH